MKRSLSLLLIVLFCATVKAQFKPIAEGPVFKEPEDGFAKILEMKSGGTLFFRITNKDGIDIRVYDPSHKETVVTNVKPSYGKLKQGYIEGVFEINGDAVLLISEVDSRTPVLYRLIVDAKTGTLKDDKKIGELSRVGFMQGYAMAFGDVPMPEFYVRKDPNSDNYAVVKFNSFESERSKRIEIVTYGADNKETGRAFYASPEEKYKYLRYVDMAVIGSDKVCVLAYGFNTKNSGGKESELIMANLDKGATSVNFTELGFSKDLIVDNGIARYSPATKSLVLIALAREKQSSNSYIPLLAFVNPFERKINRVDPISPSEKLGGYNGLPQNLFVNADGTFTVVSEKMTIDTHTGGSYGGSITETILGDMAVVNYSKTGEMVSEYLIRKNHVLNQTYLDPFYHSVREGTAQTLVKGNQFKSFAYLDGKSKSFILFNDTERNNDKQESGKLVGIKGVSDCDGFYYPLAGDAVTPKRGYVFGNPASKRDHDLGLFSISDYDRKNDLYITLELSKESGKKGVKVVWLQP